MPLGVGVLAYLTLAADLGVAALLLYAVLDRFTSVRLRAEDTIRRRYREIGFVLALVATGGSLYLSQIVGWTPCKLCWLQRIFMYPLVLLFGTSLVLERRDVREYTLPLVMVGGMVAIYHYLVQRVSSISSGCSGVAFSCSMEYTVYFGYVTIPMMALTAFAGIGVVLWLYADED
jgi:disulfide bond formation protein DsbB